MDIVCSVANHGFVKIICIHAIIFVVSKKVSERLPCLFLASSLYSIFHHRKLLVFYSGNYSFLCCFFVIIGCNAHMHTAVCACVHACALTGPMAHQSWFMDCDNIQESYNALFISVVFDDLCMPLFLCLQLQPYLRVSDIREC